MTAEEWQEIEKAKDLLGLDDRASFAEIKKAFRQLSKKYHPDLLSDDDLNASGVRMQELTDAYRLLLEYCAHFPIPLVPGQDTLSQDDENWWFERFGQDPLWGKGGQ